MNKIVLIILSFLFLSTTIRADEIIQAGVKYSEASAKIEAFKDVQKKIKKEFYKQFLKDINRKENIENIKSDNFKIENRILCPFYLKTTLASYALKYQEYPEYTFYYNILGNLIKFDIIKEKNYPQKVYGYSRYGNLISVSFVVDEYEQFVYDENGKLIAHWVDKTALDSDNKMPKFLKLQRGKLDKE